MGALKVTQQPSVVTHTALDSEVGRSADLYVGNPGLKGNRHEASTSRSRDSSAIQPGMS
jgi:hypothetical protein